MIPSAANISTKHTPTAVNSRLTVLRVVYLCIYGTRRATLVECLEAVCVGGGWGAGVLVFQQDALKFSLLFMVFLSLNTST